jgi:hypothetical protein
MLAFKRWSYYSLRWNRPSRLDRTSVVQRLAREALIPRTYLQVKAPLCVTCHHVVYFRVMKRAAVSALAIPSGLIALLVVDALTGRGAPRWPEMVLTGSTLVTSVAISLIFWHKSHQLQERIQLERESLRNQLIDARVDWPDRAFSEAFSPEDGPAVRDVGKGISSN